jgi:hypothetical protein
MQGINEDRTHRHLLKYLVRTISETNGISLKDTLELLATSELREKMLWPMIR